MSSELRASQDLGLVVIQTPRNTYRQDEFLICCQALLLGRAFRDQGIFSITWREPHSTFQH